MEGSNLLFQNGDTYIGAWSNDMMHGQGVSINEGKKYKGLLLKINYR